MAASVESADGDLGFQVAPMIDVVFVLMLFFMAVVGWEKTKELRALLPAPHSQGTTTIAMVEIAVDGSVIFNGETLGSPQDSELPQLRARFQHILQQFGDKDPVMIRPASNIRHERVMQVLDAVQAAGVAKVTFL